MGIIASLTNGRFAPSVNIDFNGLNAEGKSGNRAISNSIDDTILSKFDQTLSALQTYSGATKEMQKAMSTPNVENEIECFLKLIQCVDTISLLFNFTKQVENIIPIVLDFLSISQANNNKKDAKDFAQKEYNSKQGVAIRLIEILSYSVIFDNARMKEPLIPNDFSYYRRMLPKYGNNPITAPHVKVHDDEASIMALFTPVHNPMFTALLNATKTAVARSGKSLSNLGLLRNEDINEANTLPQNNVGGGNDAIEVLAIVSNSCYSLLKKKDTASTETTKLINAMSIACILYDHVSDLGVYSKKSTIKVKEIISLIKNEYPEHNNILNLFKYSSKTLSNAPANIQSLLED